MKINLFSYTSKDLFYYHIVMPRKNTTAKIAAIIATLIAIIWSIISTGALVIYENYFGSPNSETSLTPEQLQELLPSFSGATTQSGAIENMTMLLNDTLAGAENINEINQ